MRLILPAILAFTLFAAGGCASARRDSTDRRPAPQGRIAVSYLWTDADQSAPPVGFHVWRSPTAHGPFQQVTKAPVPARPQPAGGVQVLRVEEGLPLDADFYYYLEAVDASGKRRRASDVVRAQVLLPQEVDLPKAKESTPP